MNMFKPARLDYFKVVAIICLRPPPPLVGRGFIELPNSRGAKDHRARMPMALLRYVPKRHLEIN